jgi:hypothetical protein
MVRDGKTTGMIKLDIASGHKCQLDRNLGRDAEYLIRGGMQSLTLRLNAMG